MFEATIDYIKSALDSIVNALATTKETILLISEGIATVAQILGFIGLRVFVLLIMTTLIIWILNLSSPTTKRMNYFISVGLVVWIALNANMPITLVIFKYMLFILTPMLMAQTINFMIKVGKISNKMINKKVTNYIAKKSFFAKKLSIPEVPIISVLFTSLLPTKNEMLQIIDVVKEKSKILLIDNNGKILFTTENKTEQFIKSCEDDGVNLMWCYGNKYGCNEIVKPLERMEKILQTKYIIGNGDNSFLLNFLQNQWGWKVIYTNNYDRNLPLTKVENTPLKLLNNHKFTEENWTIKKRIVASDLSVFTIYPLSCDRKILYLDGIVENEILLYRYLHQVEKVLMANKQKPEAIIIGNINIEVDMAKIIYDFDKELKKKLIYVPFFYAENLSCVLSNEKCLIEYKGEEILLKQ
ncbi:MAG: LD-carboxypeptidase [Rickettsiales bacterium]|jgi:hypothetical protein|nr:LD-carboxypeptidase [Rickettsiales bacterium]